MADEVVAEPARGLAEKIDAVNAMTKRLAEKTSGLPKGGLPAVIRSQNTLEAENARLRERLAQTEDIVLQQRRDHERLESTVDGIIDEAQKLESHNQRLENGLIALTTEVRDLRARVGMLAPPGAGGADETSIAVIDMLERVFKTLPANADKPLQQLAQLERACVALRTHTSTLGAAFGVVPEIGAVGAGVAPADENARGSSAGAAAGAAERADAAADVPPPPPAQPTSADGSAVGEATREATSLQ